MKKNKDGFTIVELLVVITIITILVGILLPALASAKKSARSTVCESNLRQLAIGWMAFETDHQYIMPGYVSDGAILKQWNVTVDYAHYGDPLKPNSGFISPYIPSNTVQGCPAMPHKDDDHSGYTTYGYNNTFPTETGIKITSIKQPSRTVTFADAASLSAGEISTTSFLDPPSTSLTGGSYGGIHYFHTLHTGMTGNVAWADGHVTPRKAEYYSDASQSKQTLTEARLGYIDSDGNATTDELFDFK